MHYIFGSWFDPVTHAHEAIIKKISKTMKVGDRLTILVADNDEKPDRTPVEERVNMVHTALASKNIKYDLYRQNTRLYDFVSYNFKDENPENITIVLGEDEWDGLCNGKWVNSRRLLDAYRFIVVARYGTELKYGAANAKAVSIDRVRDISSSAARAILDTDPLCHYKVVQKYISRTVFDYIKEHGLYWQNPQDYADIEKKFVENYRKQGWGSFANTVDIVAVCGDEVLLIRRKNPPYKNFFCTPGGFFDAVDGIDKSTGEVIRADQDLEHAARRELREETGMDIPVEKFRQIRTYSHMFDPRLRIVDTAFLVRVSARDKKAARAADDAADARWFKLDSLPKLGFHHADILADAVEKLNSRNK